MQEKTVNPEFFVTAKNYTAETKQNRALVVVRSGEAFSFSFPIRSLQHTHEAHGRLSKIIEPKTSGKAKQHTIQTPSARARSKGIHDALGKLIEAIEVDKSEKKAQTRA